MRELTRAEMVMVAGGHIPADQVDQAFEHVVVVLGTRILASASIGGFGGNFSDQRIADFVASEMEHHRIDIEKCEGPSAGQVALASFAGATASLWAAARFMNRYGPLMPPHIRAAIMVPGATGTAVVGGAVGALNSGVVSRMECILDQIIDGQ